MLYCLIPLRCHVFHVHLVNSTPAISIFTSGRKGTSSERRYHINARRSPASNSMSRSFRFFGNRLRRFLSFATASSTNRRNGMTECHALSTQSVKYSSAMICIELRGAITFCRTNEAFRVARRLVWERRPTVRGLRDRLLRRLRALRDRNIWRRCIPLLSRERFL
jgi:hypothetical protein